MGVAMYPPLNIKNDQFYELYYISSLLISSHRNHEANCNFQPLIALCSMHIQQPEERSVHVMAA